MKKNILLICSALLSVSLLTNCGQAPKDSTAKADSINHTNVPSNSASDGGVIKEVNGDDSKFAVAAANGGMAEVALGKLAQEKATSQQVKDFGVMMVTDHTKANMELKAIAKPQRIMLPDSLNNEELKIKNELSAKSGADFDKAYVQAMVEDHENDIKEFERAAKVVKTPEMLAFVNKTLPVLKMHLADIQKIKAQMK